LAATGVGAAEPELTEAGRQRLAQEASRLSAAWVQHYGQGRLPAAVTQLEQVVAAYRRLYPQGHPDLAAAVQLPDANTPPLGTTRRADVQLWAAFVLSGLGR
jgi:hypothetical protein